MHAHAPAAPRSIDDNELHRRQGVSQRAFHRSLAEGSRGGFVVQRAGDVQATVVPAASRLAILNSVFYADREALGAVLEELGAIYREAGVSGWTVWVPPWDRPAARLLRAAGHSRSGAVMVTAALLAELDLEPEMEIELDPCASAELAARCNDRAHGLAEGQTMVDAFKGLDRTSTRAYAARHRGELACAAVVRYDGGNCYPWGLAATRAARGSMVTIELMRTILRDALAAGCETETGEVTRAGETLGRYLGKRPIGRYDTWVRRD